MHWKGKIRLCDGHVPHPGNKKPKVECYMITVRPLQFPRLPRPLPLPIQEVQPESSRVCEARQEPEDQESGQQTKQPAGHPDSLQLRTPLPQPGQSQGPPLLTQSPLQCGPEDSPSTHCSSSSNSGNPEGTSQNPWEATRTF